MAHWLRRMLAPKSIAIVGASERDGSLAAFTHRQLISTGYAGEIFSVNPKYQTLHQAPCFASLDQLPVVPDLVVYAISGLALEQSFDQAIALQVGGIVIFAANHIENESSPKLTERLKIKAQASAIPVCGGNSMGFYNYDDNVLVSFDNPPADRPAGHIALMVHSGSGMTYLANNDARFCFNYVIASAQEISASIGDYMDYLIDQPSTRVIAILLETVRDVPAFVAALQKARERSIPVVITRLGRTEKSAQLALSHSGAIVGNHEAFVAVCQRSGAILCKDADEMIVTAMLFAANFKVTSGGLASMLDSGGMREQMVDLAEDYGLQFARISPATTAVLRANLEPHLDAVNPMDGMGDLGRDTARTYLECGKALLDDSDTGLLSFEFEFRDGFSHYPELFEVAQQLAAHNDKPVVLLNSCTYTSVTATALEMTAQGIPVINGIDVALRAIANLVNFEVGPVDRDKSSGIQFDADLIRHWKQQLAEQSGCDEITALKLMSDFGLPAVEFVLAEDMEQVISAAEQLEYPLVLKTAEAGIAHKSDQGGVKVGIKDREQLQQACQDLQTRLGNRVVAMPMIDTGVEVSVGMKNDPQFGPMIIVACGGVMIELLAERSFSLAPVDHPGANALVDQTRLAKLLAGIRGQEPVDRESLIELIVRFSQLVCQFKDEIAEIDLNPVIVNSRGCTIADALIVPKKLIN